MLSVHTEIILYPDRHVWKSTESLPPLPPIKELIGFEQFVWPTHFGLEGAQAPEPPLVVPLHKTLNMIAALRQALYTQTSFCAFFSFKKVTGFFYLFHLKKKNHSNRLGGSGLGTPPVRMDTFSRLTVPDFS